MDIPALDFSKIRTYPVVERSNKVVLDSFAKPHTPGVSLLNFIDNLPAFLAVEDLRAIVRDIATARRNNKPVVLMMGAHPIKVGLNPIIVDLLRSGIVTAVALNGAGAIHDFELCFQGETSEDVQRGLNDGSFGMAEETGRMMNEAFRQGARQGQGAGQSLGAATSSFPNRHLSILATAYDLKLPLSVHIAIGTDIIHQHPHCDGAALGACSYSDFQLLASVLAQLEGGVVLNVGSAVVLPEVFLKALTVARNLGNRVATFTTATFDMTRHYRPTENVQRRPTALGGKGYYLIGHHEINIPLIFAAVKEALAQ